MSEIDALLRRAVEDRAVPFVVAMYGDADGIHYTGAAGQAADGRTADPDTAFRVFSMTKAVGSLAAMILIDRGQLSMDTPVAEILPAWNDLQVLEGFDGDAPILRPQRSVATIRHLATHTSGIEYEFWNADVPRYMKATGHPTMLTGLSSALHYPLTSDPGTRWGYGPGIDWLGQVVEAVDGRRIDLFCQQEIFDPLAMGDTSFESDTLGSRLADVSMRGADGGFLPRSIAPPARPEIYGMGHALYSTAGDYMRLLRMILNGGALDGQRVLSPAAMEEMLADQMQGLSIEPMYSNSSTTADVKLAGDPGHSFFSARNRADISGKRAAGTQSWAGILNTHYWVDPHRNVAAVLMTQSLPFLDPQFLGIYDSYERAVYRNMTGM